MTNNSENKILKQVIIDWYKELKISIGCQKCGYNKCPQALEFHHMRHMKRFNISWAIQNLDNIGTIIKEMKKCVLVCANCHRELHNLKDNKFSKKHNNYVLRVILNKFKIGKMFIYRLSNVRSIVSFIKNKNQNK